MNKTLVILALLCGTANAVELAPVKELTPAQKAEVAKRIGLLGTQIEQHTKELEQASPDDKGAVRLLKARIKGLNEIKESIKADEPAYWMKLQKKMKYSRLYWKEPAKGEKEGKWVPWKEVAG